MLSVQHMHLETVPRAVSRFEACSLSDSDNLTARRDHQSRSETLVSPSQADHVVISAPMEKGGVRGMVNNQSAACTDVLFERVLKPAGPANPGVGMSAVEVINHHTISGEIRMPRVPRNGGGVRRRGRRDIHREAP